MLRGRGCNIVFADANEVFCVEQNARYYAIRQPGDLGEKGNNYLVHANHFKSKKGCFDENNVFHPEKSMSDFTPEQKERPNGSYYRFWSGMWMVRNNYGRIDEKVMMEELVPSHTGYDEEGNRYDPDPIPVSPQRGDSSPRNTRVGMARSVPTSNPTPRKTPWGWGETLKRPFLTCRHGRSGGFPYGRVTSRNGNWTGIITT